MRTRFQDPSTRLSAGFIPQPIVYEEIPFEPVQWEYRLISIDTREEALPDEEWFNTLGRDGWLLNTLLPVEKDQQIIVHYYFMRQRPRTKGEKK